MPVHVEVPGDFGQRELHAFQLWSEDDLASQPGVLLKHGRHVQHVILPKAVRNLSVFTVTSTRIQMVIEDMINSRPTSPRGPAVCQSEHGSRRRDTLSRPAMPHRLLNKRAAQSKSAIMLQPTI